jgi:hypothetical protein
MGQNFSAESMIRPVLPGFAGVGEIRATPAGQRCRYATGGPG